MTEIPLKPLKLVEKLDTSKMTKIPQTSKMIKIHFKIAKNTKIPPKSKK